MAADGQSPDFDAGFEPPTLLSWFVAARAAMMAGRTGIAVGACSRCTAPLTVSRRLRVQIPCPHCATLRDGPAGEILFDQWTEPWTAAAKTDQFQIEYRLKWQDAEEGGGCPGCGLIVSPGARNCGRCGSNLWISEEGLPKRQLAVLMEGTRNGQPVRTVMSLPAGIRALQADATLGAAASTKGVVSRTLLLGCGGLLALTVLGVGLIIVFMKAC